ncbi:MAG: carbon monoxide dehydrogenase [Lachnospiraceae bacterium]|nr:carbon monoxide dehydrogenase [Lachnospiraceae bacterium]
MDCDKRMNLFDGMITNICGQLNHIAAMEEARLEKLSRAWPDAGGHHMILGKETAYELGGQNTLGLSGCLCTAKPLLAPQGVYLYGNDLTQISESQSYARIVFLQVAANTDEEALYRKIREIDYVRYHIHPEGFMARISPVSQREPVRISKKALKKNISFSDIGQMYLERYLKISQVRNVNVIFVTHRDFDYRALEEMLGRAEQITQSLNHIFTSLNMDCGTCHLKTVCDEVEGLRELHFGQKNHRS